MTSCRKRTGATGPTSVNTNASLLGNGSVNSPLGLSGFGQNTNTARQGSGTHSDGFLGDIYLTAANVAEGLPCDGQLLSIAQNAALFALLGTNFGGNGTSTFGIPDLRADAPNGLTYYIETQGIFPS